MGDPFISGLDPTNGKPAEGTVVDLTGTDLSGSYSVYFGETPAIATGTSSTTATVTAPPHAAGVVKVATQGKSGPSATSAWPATNATSLSVDITPHDVGADGNVVMGIDFYGSGAPGSTPLFYRMALATKTASNPHRCVSLSAAGSNLAVPNYRINVGYPNPYSPHGTSVLSINAEQSYAFIEALYEWEVDHTYRLTFTRNSGSGSGYWWGLTVTDLTTAVTATNIIELLITGLQPSLALANTKLRMLCTNVPVSAAARQPYSVSYTTLRADGTVTPSLVTPVVAAPYESSSVVSGGLRFYANKALAWPEFTYTEYEDPPPTITSLSPDSGPAAGGTTVTITGTNFVDVTGVKFGGFDATSFTVDSSTQITAVAPSHAVVGGDVDVFVYTDGGGPNVTAAVYTYDGLTIADDLVTITAEITQPTTDPTGGLLHKVLITYTPTEELPPVDGVGTLRVTATVPTGLLAGAGAAAVSFRSRLVASGVPGVWSASQNIGTTRVATREVGSMWLATQEFQIELAFVATVAAGSYDIGCAAVYQVPA